MTINNLNARRGDQRPFATAIGHRRVSGWRGLSLLLGLLVLGACQAGQPPTPGTLAVTGSDVAASSVKPEESRMWMIVGERRFAITLTDNLAARAFAAQLPLTLELVELNGNEKHAELVKALPTNASRPGTIRAGDLMLYGANTLVVFYSSSDSSYAYTRLGQVDDPAGLAQALGRRGVRGVFAKDQ